MKCLRREEQAHRIIGENELLNIRMGESPRGRGKFRFE